MPDALSGISTRHTPQSEQADSRQVPNSAGGWGFQVSSEAYLYRFLTLGTEGGTFYADAPRLTKASAGHVIRMAKASDPALLDAIENVSLAGRAPRVNPALFALAAAAGLGDTQYRQAALDRLPLVARTGSHLLTWAGYAEQFRGWGPAMTKAVGSWYNSKELAEVIYQVLKYKQRDGWSQRDLMRLAHFGRTPVEGNRRLFYDYVMKGDWPSMWTDPDGAIPDLLGAYRRIWSTTDPRYWVRAITDQNQLSARGWITHEMLPSEALASPAVWEALLYHGLPLGALIRNLGRLTRMGVLAPMSENTVWAAGRLTNADQLKAARIHPVNVLVALRTYASGHGVRSQDTWNPVSKITDALDEAFYAAYGAVEPSGKRIMLAVDISGSMDSAVAGLPLSCREAAAALSLVTAGTEPRSVITAFTHGAYGSRWSGYNGMGSGLTEMPISRRQRLDDVIRTASRLQMGGTNCAVPMLEAMRTNTQIDVFEILTDNETWYGTPHPHQALEQYRQKSGIDARLSVVAFTPTNFTIADPADPRTLDVSGFDSAVPQLLSDFAAGRI